jgi:hypothetical protein
MIIPYAVVADDDCTNALTTSHHCETLSFTMDQPPHVFEQLGSELMQRDSGRQTRTGDRRFRSTFGTTAVVCCRLWHLLQPVQTMQQGASPRHLLWALMLLKIYSTESVLSTMAQGVDEKTFRKWAWMFIDEISYLEASVVSEKGVATSFFPHRPTSFLLYRSSGPNCRYLTHTIACPLDRLDCLGEPFTGRYWE